MRCDRFWGLPPIALQFLKENEIPPEACECCKRIFPRKFELIGYYSGYDKYPPETCECCKRIFPQKFELIGYYSEYDKYPLYQHQLKDGVANEFLQACKFSSGPCLFLGLQVINNDGAKDFRWTDEEIEACLQMV